MFYALYREGRRFESTSSHCVVTLDKLLTSFVYEEGNGKSPHSSNPQWHKANGPGLGGGLINVIVIIISQQAYVLAQIFFLSYLKNIIFRKLFNQGYASTYFPNIDDEIKTEQIVGSVAVSNIIGN